MLKNVLLTLLIQNSIWREHESHCKEHKRKMFILKLELLFVCRLTNTTSKLLQLLRINIQSFIIETYYNLFGLSK